jgi:ribosomal protein S18 acetylase RimI-like enzyme
MKAMNDAQFPAATPADYPVIARFIHRLYQEDPTDEPVSDERIQRTFIELAAHPEKGTVLAIEKDRRIIGYAILVNFWSNEYGGNVLTIDELYVEKEFRGQGVATGLVRYLIESKFNDAVALQLEVSPRNLNAKRLYKAFGFSSHKNETMHLKLG